MEEKYLLEAFNIIKEYPGVIALNDVSFNLKKGEIHCFVGENGAGKSTIAKILSGSVIKNSGKIFIEGEEVGIVSPGKANDLGISIIYQDSDSNLIPEFTVAQNIFLGREVTNRLKFIQKKNLYQNAQKIINDLNINLDIDKKILHLSNAEKTLVQIAKAISLNSKILVIDEPTSSLPDAEKEALIKVLISLKNKGQGIIFISHHIEEIIRVGDRITILRDGQHIVTKNKVDLNKQEIIEMMVGRKIIDESLVRDVDENTILELKNISSKKGISNISFKLSKGEILGFAGIVGSGRTEIARVLFGVDMPTNGSIYLNGEKVIIKSPMDAIKKGIAMVSEDRINEGILPDLSVMENITLSSLEKVSKFGFKIKKLQSQNAKKMVKALSIKTPSIKQPAKYLSGGNQQKVVLSKWLNTNVKIIILDEPTKGIDVAGKSDIHNLVAKLAREGMSFIMISSELPELLKACNRIIVMRKGNMVSEFSSSEASQVKIMSLMGGLSNE